MPNIENIKRLVDAWDWRFAKCNRLNELLVPSPSKDGKDLVDSQRHRPRDDVVSQKWRPNDVDEIEGAPTIRLGDCCPTTVETRHDVVVDKTPLILNRLSSQGRGINLIHLGLGELLLDYVEANVGKPIPRQREVGSVFLGKSNLGAIGETIDRRHGERDKGLDMRGIVRWHYAHVVDHAVQKWGVGLADIDSDVGGADLVRGEVSLDVSVKLKLSYIYEYAERILYYVLAKKPDVIYPITAYTP